MTLLEALKTWVDQTKQTPPGLEDAAVVIIAFRQDGSTAYLSQLPEDQVLEAVEG